MNMLSCTIPMLFASHDWGKGGCNHARVAKIVQRLQEKHAMRVWLDDTHMKGNILDALPT